MARMSPAARQHLLIAFEAPDGPALHAYQDPGGVWTIGYGHTGLATGAPISAETAITMDQALALLDADLAAFEEGVENALSRPASPWQFDAMVDLAYNAGLAAFTGSAVLRAFNAGRLFEAACAFWEYIHDAQGAILPGLVRRRVAEAVWFAGGMP
jgi:lysozyme